jgi:hypothetical protein
VPREPRDRLARAVAQLRVVPPSAGRAQGKLRTELRFVSRNQELVHRGLRFTRRPRRDSARNAARRRRFISWKAVWKCWERWPVERAPDWSSATYVTRPQAGMVSESRLVVTIRPIVVRMNRKTGIALISALILWLHSVVFCAAGVPNCSPAFVGARHHQEQGCHEHQRHEPCESHCRLSCESVLSAPRSELTRPDGRSASDRVSVFAPLCIAVLSLNLAHSDGNLPRVSESPPYQSIPVFLIQKTLLI